MLGTTHSTLSHRIHRFVAVFERYKRRPDRDEARHVLSAIDCLRQGSYEQGEQAIVAAEQVFAHAEPRARPRCEAGTESASEAPLLTDNISTHDLRAALRSVIHNKG